MPEPAPGAKAYLDWAQACSQKEDSPVGWEKSPLEQKEKSISGADADGYAYALPCATFGAIKTGDNHEVDLLMRFS